MNGNGNPLGKYAIYVAVGVAVAGIGLALLQHFFLAIGWVSGTPDAFIDGLAYVAIGIVLGTSGSLITLNGTVRKAEQATQNIATLAAVSPNVTQIGDKVVVNK
jgi:hypothetical protein